MGKYKLIVLLVVSLFYSCGDCENSAQSYKSNEIEIILMEKPIIYGDMKCVGKKISSSKISTIIIKERWYYAYIHDMEIGDTIIKRKGELVFSIHKKDTVMSFNWECGGRIYE